MNLLQKLKMLVMNFFKDRRRFNYCTKIAKLIYSINEIILINLNINVQFQTGSKLSLVSLD